MNKAQHKKTEVASMFKMVFLGIPNVLKGTVFAEKVTYISNAHWPKLKIIPYFFLQFQDLLVLWSEFLMHYSVLLE